MAELLSLRAASAIQLKCYNFALAFQIKATHGDKKFDNLYRLAKCNLGVRSLVFGLDQYKTKMNKCEGPEYFYAMGLLQSLEVQDSILRYRVRNLQRTMAEVIHTEHMRRQWADVTTDMKLARSTYHTDVVHIATKFWDEERQDVLLILADALEESGADFESQHLRVGFHSPACPVILKILKGLYGS